MFVVNFFAVLVPNIAYVWVVSKYNSAIQTVAGFAITIYKLVWNKYALAKLIHTGEHEGFTLELILSAFNLVMAPAIALMTANSNCFKEALFATESVRSSYQINICSFDVAYFSYTNSNDLRGLPIVKSYMYVTKACEDTTGSVSFQPSFNYGYECSATLLETYSPVFIFSALLMCFWQPFFEAGLRFLIEKKVLSPKFSVLLPILMQTQAERQDHGKDSEKCQFRVLDLRSLSMVVLQNLVIALTFGTVSPLLGFVIVVFVCSFTLRWHFMLATFYRNEDEISVGCLVADCSDFCMHFASQLLKTRWFILFFSCLYLSFFLVDTAGDSVGLRASLWAPILMCTLSPALCRLVETLFNRSPTIPLTTTLPSGRHLTGHAFELDMTINPSLRPSLRLSQDVLDKEPKLKRFSFRRN